MKDLSKHTGILLLMIALLSCTKKESMPAVLPPLPATDTSITTPPATDTTVIVDTPVMNTIKTYLALGDSYTIGQSVAENERFPVQVKDKLLKDGITMQAPDIIATTGWTTINLQNAIKARNLSSTYDMVTLLIGVNDQYRGLDTASYRIHFTELLQKSVLLAGNKPAHVIVLSIPDYSVTPFALYSDTARIRKQLDDFNAINKELTLANKVNYIDITPATREAKYDSSLLANDGLHPSGIEYGKWADMIVPIAKNIFK